MDQWWWYLSRATGIVATALAVASLVWGLFFSARNTGKRRPAAWWLDLHNYLGGLALIFTGAHLLASLLDPNSGIGLVEVLVPGTAPSATWAVTWGVLAAYIFAITVFTSWPKRRFSRRVWRAVHLASVLGVALAGLHGMQLGSDATIAIFEAGLIVCAGLAAYALTLRIIGVIGRAITQ
jgi:predicted ferric reductase